LDSGETDFCRGTVGLTVMLIAQDKRHAGVLAAGGFPALLEKALRVALPARAAVSGEARPTHRWLILRRFGT
jgi:hypothetical protein